MNENQTNRYYIGNKELFQFGSYLKVLRKHWFSIVTLSLVITLAATWFIYSKPSIYQATATILIQEEQRNALSIEEVYGLDTTKKEYFQTQIAILQSNHIADKIIQQFDLTNHPHFTGSSSLKTKLNELKSVPLIQDLLNVSPNPTETNEYHSSYYEALQSYKNRVDIEPIRNTQLVKVSFRSADPKLAAEIANAIGQAYIDSNFEAKLTVTQNATNWLDSNARQLEDKLHKSEQALQQFLTTEGLVDINGIDDIYANELEELSKKLNIAIEKRIQAQTLSDLLLRKSAQNLDSLLSIDEFANQAQIRELKMLESNAQKLVGELSQRYGPKHDKMIQAKAQLQNIQERSQKLIMEMVLSKQQDLKVAQSFENSIRREMSNKKAEIQLVGGKKAEYEKLKRDVESNRELLKAFVNREKETTATSDFRNVNARFTDKALEPLFPIAPQRLKLVIISAVFALFFSSAAAIILDMIKDVIRTPEDVENKLGLSCIGTIPYVRSRKLRKPGVSFQAYLDPQNRVFSEACRSIRTSLLLRLVNSKQKVLVFTSAIPEEGKTATCINIASTFSNLERVLLIDCDLRRPSLEKRFNIPAQVPGLSNILTMNTPLEECIIRIDEANLDVLTAGLLPPNPQELLSSKRFQNLLNTLQEKYDRIIIDTPPLLSVSDALILGQLAQGLITVIRSDSTKVALAKTALSKQRQHDIPSFGVVISQATTPQEEAHYVQKYAY
ncbi:GumC family protein [Vibrio vulnificus]|uniref:GumC family protein n=1 Tax=Vibrio vulnificus TaxID=672 RepID=UPI0019D45BA5|nr:polysaccharide biosynthesis tyrosine autokinase [Vibrio vulnificus]EJT0552258.1 polysaccharide biosynthesis tyrosine autokinase [Vibrio vulnificus]MBN8129925.1 polysaccharide biosynthesis tyrosine autokinase [Vibrio vulnificus]MBN8134549.1 polysaccharide biosynthesis tyrosine autokinase [Vibrio vulnificus]MBN8157637.1 polysaccharide biosynthesis tyrosine autokinase [Vibrio vulnificus]